MTRITETQWLEYFGFQRFPFDRPGSGTEEFARPDFLASCFVEPRSFERVIGQPDSPTTALLFAARGTGKTACRVMVDYYCQHGQANPNQLFIFDNPDYVLPVPHLYLSEVYRLALRAASPSGKPAISVEQHANEILARAAQTLTTMAANTPHISQGIQQLPPETRHDLAQLIMAYGYYLTSPQRAYLNQLGLAMPIFETTGPQPPDYVSPVERLAQWANLMRQIGFRATYVLVDGIDEFEVTAADPEMAFTLIRPLLVSLRLMDSMPYLVLKFFLPDNLYPLVMSDNAIRHDRGFIIESIDWQIDDLRKILRRRLDSLKRASDRNVDRVEAGFDSLCVPELRGDSGIELELIQRCKGNPRHMMVLCGMMITEHCSREIVDQDDPYQLTRKDWELAQTRFGRLNWNDEFQKPINILDLIKQGEGEQLEFKSSAQTAMEGETPKPVFNSHLREPIAKAIAGMLNASGGILLIGVKDDGTILGIESDLKFLKDGRQNPDGYENLITDVIKNYFYDGLGFRNLVHVRFEMAENKTVCMVQIERSNRPVYFSHNDEFWVRLGNSTRKLGGAIADDYKRTRF